MLEIREVRSIDEFEAQIEAWDRLVEHRPMRSSVWLLNWWKEFGAGTKELRVLLVYDDGQLVGGAPLYADKLGGKGIYKLLGGSGDVCTDHTTWFARDGFQSRVGEAVGEFLADSETWNRLHLAALDEGDVAMEAMLEQLEARRCLSHRKSTVSCWKLSLPDTWEGYLGVLSKSHRKRCRRLIRSYFDTGRVAVHEATQDNFEEVRRLFLKLHASRWGSRHRPEGSFTDHRFRQFHERVSRELLERNQLRLCYLTCDGQPIAAEYQFFDGDTLYAYQSGMAPDSGSVQPGNLSLISTIQFGIQRRLKTLDLLRGDEPYKAHWRAEPTPCHDIRIWPNGIAGKVEIGLLGAKQLAAVWLNRQ